jgi:sterol desaturase/sphingolipid hydroxylase (fatty acid hydroxylase superfamily)
VHHEYPKDKGRLAMPPLVSVALALGLLYGFYQLIGEYTYAFLPGFIMGYAAYLFVHFAVHAYQPPKNFLKILWVNHGIHHYKDNNKAFGVSSPLWDIVFGTMP